MVLFIAFIIFTFLSEYHYYLITDMYDLRDNKWFDEEPALRKCEENLLYSGSCSEQLHAFVMRLLGPGE